MCLLPSLRCRIARLITVQPPSERILNLSQIHRENGDAENEVDSRAVWQEYFVDAAVERADRGGLLVAWSREP